MRRRNRRPSQFACRPLHGPKVTTSAVVTTRRAGKTARAARVLSTSALFDGLSPGAFVDLDDHVAETTVAAGEIVVRRGDPSDSLYVVAAGALDVVLESETGVQRLSTLTRGSVVGEIGVLSGETRSATVRAARRTTLVSLSAEGFRKLLAEHPRQADALAERAADRLRRTQLIEHFTALFGVSDDAVLRDVERLMEWVSISAGRLLFEIGAEGDAAYLVASGRLGVYQPGATGAEIQIGQVGRGEIVGELALLDGGPRSASVYAIRDTKLIRFSRAAYDELLHRYPHIGLAVAKTALGRQRRALRAQGDQRRSFVLVAASPDVDLSELARPLVDALPDARIVTSEDIDREIGREGMAQIGDDVAGALRLSYHLEELEDRHRHLVYVTDREWTPWSKRALRWADEVVLVAPSTNDPTPTAHELQLWSLIAQQHHPGVSLVLLHPPETKLPTGTPAWLEPRQVSGHHHVRVGDQAHVERLARLLAGSATSVVLGGGGAKGFAHLGILRTLEDRGVHVDMVGGTSIGSIMGLGPGMGWNAAEARDVSIQAFRKLFDYTLPSTSLIRGSRISGQLRRTLGEIDITDLWVPYFCVSVDLTASTVTYHDRGDLTQAIRASISIPGVLPPVPIDGSVHVDGGVLDNVPVEEMRRRNPTGVIVAVDVSPIQGPPAKDDYGLGVGGLGAMRSRRRGIGPPSIGTTLVRSLLVGSVGARNRVMRDGIADLYVTMPASGGGLLDFAAGGSIADAAVAATRQPLEDWSTDFHELHATGRPLMPVIIETEPDRASLIDPGGGRRGGGVLLLTLRDLQFRASRFGSVIVGIAVVLALLFLMTGLTEQFHREPRLTVAGFGADGWVVRDGSAGAFTSASTMPVETAAAVQGANAVPVVIGRHALTDGGAQRDIVVVGIAGGGLGSPELRDGRLPATPTEVVIDETSELAVGDSATLGTATYEVVGRTSDRTMFAGMPVVYMSIEAAQALFYRGQPLATAVLVDAPPTTLPPDTQLLSPTAVAEDAMRPLERSISSVNLIRVLLWFVAAMIIGTMTYLSALERRRDVAVLKAIGGSTRQLGSSIALQGVLIAVIAAALASVLQVVMVPIFPLQVSVPSRAFLHVPLIAVIVSLLAGAVGLRKAVNVDPALAFQGPGA